MQQFRVEATHPSRNALALRDRAGQRHWARALVDAPAVGAQLLGTAPQLGFSLMLGASTGRVFRVVFEQIDS
jgi:hypothetical protein